MMIGAHDARRLFQADPQRLDQRVELGRLGLLPVDPLLALGAHLRLTRLLTVDVMGGYLVTDPLTRARDRVHTTRCSQRQWATGHEHTTECRAITLVLEGLDCPHCCGLWVAAGVTLAYAATSRSPRARAVWRTAASALSLGYVGGHVCARLDEGSEDEES